MQGIELWQKISSLGLISCLTIGDVFNSGKNALVVICDDGWVHIYYNSQPLTTSLFTSDSCSFGENKLELGKTSGEKFDLFIFFMYVHVRTPIHGIQINLT